MILAYEACWPGTVHVTVNSAILQIMARAFPTQSIRVLADPSHLRELQRDPFLASSPALSFAPAGLSRHYRYRTNIVSLRRFLHEFRTLAAALRRMPAGEPLLIVLLSATPTAIFAASALARLRGGGCRVQVVLHGNLNDLQGWRPRNPVLRSLDLKTALEAGHGGRVRFLVLEAGIHRALARLSPRAAAQTDVLPHPVSPVEAAIVAPPPASPPLRVGFVGMATPDKGIDLFLDIARDMRARHGDRVAFYLVGSAREGTDPASFAPLAHPVDFGLLSREDFTARLAMLHYVMLPFQAGYYTLSASGGLIDAITWLKPILATRTPTVEDMFAGYGDIGVLCDDADGLRMALETTLAEGIGDRYAGRVGAMHRLRDSRMPETLSRQYHALTRAHFPAMPDHRDSAFRVLRPTDP
ncbi:MAG TPA: hypothetical protein VFN42_03130 [Acetobacteraceae bacterium]|nr:hypothetical protein [Acetobacteraceae bacterium]